MRYKGILNGFTIIYNSYTIINNKCTILSQFNLSAFFNKASLIKDLDKISPNSKMVIDCSKSKSISYDILELIKSYEINARIKNIHVLKINFIEAHFI